MKFFIYGLLVFCFTSCSMLADNGGGGSSESQSAAASSASEIIAGGEQDESSEMPPFINPDTSSDSLFSADYDAALGIVIVSWDSQRLMGSRILFTYLTYTQIVSTSAQTVVLSHLPYVSNDGSYTISCAQLLEDGTIYDYKQITVQTKGYSVGQTIYYRSANSQKLVACDTGVPAGIIYEVSENGSQYKMVALHDGNGSREGVAWSGARAEIGSVYDTYFSVPSEYINDGYLTYREIYKHYTGTQFSYSKAFTNCLNYDPQYGSTRTGSSMGWYLPARGELEKIYSMLEILEPLIIQAGGEAFDRTGNYWTATPTAALHAYYMYFSDGKVSDAGIDSYGNESYIRCPKHIRAVYNSNKN